MLHPINPHRPLRIELPWATPSQNDLHRWHWSKRRRWQTDAGGQVLDQLRGAGFFGGHKPPDCRVQMELTRVGSRLMDYGNLVGGCKLLLDELVRHHLMVDDSPTWLHDVYIQTIGRPARTLVVLTPL